MFEDCDNLIQLDLSMLDTRKVETMEYFCNSCDNLQLLDLSGAYCSTESIPATSETALKNVICNDYSLTIVKLGENFNFSSQTSVPDLFFSNPSNTSFKKNLNIWCTAQTATNLIHSCSRALSGVKLSKFVFKTTDGETNWKYYEDEELTTEITNVASVTNTSYVGLAQ